MENLIEKELEAAERYTFRTEVFEGSTLVELTRDNVAKAEACIKNDSAYTKSFDPDRGPDGRKYLGSSAYWISKRLKPLLLGGAGDGGQFPSYSECLKETINAIDRENGTHLNADGCGREEILERIQAFRKDYLLEFLKFPEKNNYKIIGTISRRTEGGRGCGRENYSFASKFCHYMCFFLFDDPENAEYRDNFSIYDNVVLKALPKYAERYGVDYTDCTKNYPDYIKIIDRIREKAARENSRNDSEGTGEISRNGSEDGGEISRNGFDHLIWYYHKGLD